MVEDSPVVLDGQSLGADDVVRVARYHAPVALHADGLDRLEASLAIVQAILRLTRAEDAATYARVVEGRIAALARAQSLLAAERWTGAPLRSVIAEELAPYGAGQPAGDEGRQRFVLTGAPVRLRAQAVQPLSIVFHDIQRAGPILDALVGQGVNQINGPDFGIEHPEAALDEARTQALQKARARADLYARAAGMGVKRIVAISEAGGYSPPAAPRPMMMARMDKASTELQPGEQKVNVSLNVTFELQ